MVYFVGASWAVGSPSVHCWVLIILLGVFSEASCPCSIFWSKAAVRRYNSEPII